MRAPGAAPLLLTLLRADDARVRALALRAYHQQDASGFFLLLSGWSDRDPLGRLVALRALAAIPDARIRDFLIRNGLRDADPRARSEALAGIAAVETALATVSAPAQRLASRTAIEAHLDATDVNERAAAARALARLGWDEALPDAVRDAFRPRPGGRLEGGFSRRRGAGTRLPDRRVAGDSRA